MTMKKIAGTALAACLFALSAPTLAGTPCHEVEDMIREKIEANGVKSFVLVSLPNGTGTQEDGKIVGSCEGGTKEIHYKKTSEAQQESENDSQKG